MNFEQPKPDSKKYNDLISEIEKGIIKIPKFQRDFVWSLDKTAGLLDSILKGYPIGTFILWQTDERLDAVKDIGSFKLPPSPTSSKVQYVLDGQQRITSLFAAYKGTEIQKPGEKKITDYKNIYVNLDADINKNEEQVITAESVNKNSISLYEILNFKDHILDIQKQFDDKQFKQIYSYSQAFDTYDFSTVLLRKENIDTAVEVFTRINTGGQTLTLFEIMAAKTYDEEQQFDMQDKWHDFIQKLEDVKYESISSSVVLNILSLILSQSKECKRRVVLSLDKQDIIDTWDDVMSALEDSIDYFRTVYRIPVSRLLAYDSLLVPFTYFFYQKKDKPSANQRKYLEEFFWRISLSFRYSSGAESKLAQDAKRIDKILNNERPEYQDIKVVLESPQELINTTFSAGNSYCKAVLCLLAYQEPKDFLDNGKVILNNSYLKMANSKNYHHFFPKAYLKGKTSLDSNSLMNITLVSDALNKRKIGSKAPSKYIMDFVDQNPYIETALASHFISLKDCGIESDDYQQFLKQRAEKIFSALKARIELTHAEPANEELEELILRGESETVEFKSTLRYDLIQKVVNKKLEFVVAKTLAAFLNSKGGNLFIGIDDKQNPLGLHDDMTTLEKADNDGFELKLIGILNKYIGKVHSSHLKISFPEYNNKQICRIIAFPSSCPVFVNFEGQEYFFVRTGCSSQPLNREEQSTYEKEHWK